MKHEYHEGKGARKNFETGMSKLFRVPKEAVKEDAKKPALKRKKASKD
jgi:hypothetical protein